MPAHRQLWLISGKTRRILEHDTVAKNDHNCLRTHKHSAIKRKQRLTTYAVRSCSSSSGLFAAVNARKEEKAPHVLHNNNNNCCCREPTHTHTRIHACARSGQRMMATLRQTCRAAKEDSKPSTSTARRNVRSKIQ